MENDELPLGFQISASALLGNDRLGRLVQHLRDGAEERGECDENSFDPRAHH